MDILTEAKRIGRENRKRAEAFKGPHPTVVVHGKTHPIQGPWWTDEEVAGKVRMLMRGDLDHESICTLARDRILYLSQELARVRADFAALQTALVGQSGLSAIMEAHKLRSLHPLGTVNP
jgi:hypothetical protein